MSRFFGTVGHIESFLCIMSPKSVAMGHIAFFWHICPGKQKKRDIVSKFSCIYPSEQKKRDIADKFPCICPSEQKKKDIADKFPCICPEREKKIQPADFHTYVNIQKAMCIKNPATEGGKDILWRIYKKNRFRELFLVGTDSTPTPFVKIQQPLLFWWFYITSAL